MKSIKKIVTAVISTALVLLVCGCSKTITVTNDPQLEQSLYGTWNIAVESQIEVWSDPDTEFAKYLGTATVLTTNQMIFSPDQNFQIINSATLSSVKIHDDAFVSEEDLKLQMEKAISIQGKFSVDKDYLELKSETVKVNNTTSYTAEEYTKIDSSFGSADQIQKWALSGNNLTISDLSAKSTVVFTKQ